MAAGVQATIAPVRGGGYKRFSHGGLMACAARPRRAINRKASTTNPQRLRITNPRASP
jgi:hypothetical protein